MPPSITTFTRLEPRPRAPSVAPGLAARIRDPLWMLAQQWRSGELRGEDAASPAWVQLAATTSAFTGWSVEGDQTVRPLGLADPLEDVVESEPLTPDLALRVELGQVFAGQLAKRRVARKVVRALQHAYPLAPLPARPNAMLLLTVPLNQRTKLNSENVTSTLRTAFANGGIAVGNKLTIGVVARNAVWLLTDSSYHRRYALRLRSDDEAISVYLVPSPELEGDAEAARFHALCFGRAIDGVTVHRAASARLQLLPTASLGRSGPALKASGDALVAWVEELYGPLGLGDPPAWRPERLEYRLAAVANTPERGTATLEADPGRSGTFDWFAFDLAASTTGTNQTQSIGFSMLPGHVRFAGMPSQRWWGFESGRAPFGEIQPDKRDVAKLVLMDFMLVHGNDWFAIPLEQAVGSLCRIDSLVVHDVFGVETLIERADAAPAAASELWTLFSTAVAGKPDEVADFFLLPPSAAGAAQVASASEEVRFLRDEMANLVWAVEETTENGVGEPWPGRERDDARRAARGERPPVTTSGGTDGPPPLRYLIQTPAPESWIPFLPVLIDPATGSIRLERSLMERQFGPDGVVLPLGRILRPTNLNPGDPYRVFEEEVPREGTRVSRHFVRSRWTDGSTHLWIARRRASGAEGTSGLRFDLAVPAGRSPDEA
jgi:hypothetical protein